MSSKRTVKVFMIRDLLWKFCVDSTKFLMNDSNTIVTLNVDMVPHLFKGKCISYFFIMRHTIRVAMNIVLAGKGAVQGGQYND